MKQAKETKPTTHTKPTPHPPQKNKEQKITNKKTNWRKIETGFKPTNSHQYPDTKLHPRTTSIDQSYKLQTKKAQNFTSGNIAFLKRIPVGEWKLWNPFWVLVGLAFPFGWTEDLAFSPFGFFSFGTVCAPLTHVSLT